MAKDLGYIAYRQGNSEYYAGCDREYQLTDKHHI